MADNVEDQSFEINESVRTPDAAKHESTISDDAKQKTWDEAIALVHKNDMHPSDVQGMKAVDSFGIDFGDGTIETSKGMITSSDSISRTIPLDGPYGISEAAHAAGRTIKDHWNPDKGLLNLLEDGSWSKLQMYAGDVGRANGWEGINGGDQWMKVNSLRHALATAYVTFNYGALTAVLAGDWHELETAFGEVGKGVPWSNNPEDKKTWNDHSTDIHNNLAGAKIAQQMINRGGSWHEVEAAIVKAVSQVGDSGRITHPNVQLRTFLSRLQ